MSTISFVFNKNFHFSNVAKVYKIILFGHKMNLKHIFASCIFYNITAKICATLSFLMQNILKKNLFLLALHYFQ